MALRSKRKGPSAVFRGVTTKNLSTIDLAPMDNLVSQYMYRSRGAVGLGNVAKRGSVDKLLNGAVD